jgi:hypothetical protein
MSDLAELLMICLALIVLAMVMAGLVYLNRRIIRDTKRQSGRWGINPHVPPCLSCGAIPPRLRIPKNWRQFAWGGWTCPQCGLELDKWGRPVADQPFPAKWSAQLDDAATPERPADERCRNSPDNYHRGEFRD